MCHKDIWHIKVCLSFDISKEDFTKFWNFQNIREIFYVYIAETSLDLKKFQEFNEGQARLNKGCPCSAKSTSAVLKFCAKPGLFIGEHALF